MKYKCGAVTAAILVFLVALQAAAAAMPEMQGKLNSHGSQEGLKIQADDIGIASASGLNHAFIWDKTTGMKDLGTLGGSYSYPYAINDMGQVVGYSFNASGEIHAFIWNRMTGMKDLGTLGGSQSLVYAINDMGQVVGQSKDASGFDHAFIWNKKTGMKDLGTLGGSFSAASAINDMGQVAGSSTN
ncbi:MAG TPA: hypothetical protein VKL21_06140 [Candidatus Methanoperedens sp.]|nr:hypothetical protein [Candidatus Methanoperedens sp.]